MQLFDVELSSYLARNYKIVPLIFNSSSQNFCVIYLFAAWIISSSKDA